MNKYSKDRLKEMAKICLKAKDLKSPSYYSLVHLISMFTGLHPTIVENRIGDYADE